MNFAETWRFFPCPLPDYKGRNTVPDPARHLYFDEDWTLRMEPVLRKGYASWFADKNSDDYMLWKEKTDLRRILENALEPVLNRLSHRGTSGGGSTRKPPELETRVHPSDNLAREAYAVPMNVGFKTAERSFIRQVGLLAGQNPQQ